MRPREANDFPHYAPAVACFFQPSLAQPQRSRNIFLTQSLHVPYTIRCGCIAEPVRSAGLYGVDPYNRSIWRHRVAAQPVRSKSSPNPLCS